MKIVPKKKKKKTKKKAVKKPKFASLFSRIVKLQADFLVFSQTAGFSKLLECLRSFHIRNPRARDVFLQRRISLEAGFRRCSLWFLQTNDEDDTFGWRSAISSWNDNRDLFERIRSSLSPWSLHFWVCFCLRQGRRRPSANREVLGCRKWMWTF